MLTNALQNAYLAFDSLNPHYSLDSPSPPHFNIRLGCGLSDIKESQMARIKGAQNRKTRSKKLFTRSKGFFLARNNTRRQANEAVMKARANAFVGRKQKKRQFWSTWVARISAAAKPTASATHSSSMVSSWPMLNSTARCYQNSPFTSLKHSPAS